MAPIVNRTRNCIKKSGAGGSFTWGHVLDCQDYEPIGHAFDSGVKVAPAKTTVSRTQSGSLEVSITDVSAFPMLQSAMREPSASRSATSKRRSVTADMPEEKSGVVEAADLPSIGESPVDAKTVDSAASDIATDSTAATLPQAAQGASGLPVRESKVDYNAQHPRNKFAKVPKKAAAEGHSPALAIDWSLEGAPAVQQAAYNTLPNPAHLGPYADGKAALAVPMNVLKAQPRLQDFIPKTNAKGHAPKQQFVRPKMTQPRGH
eukprot:TRINITY_DN19035_c0_g1_i1.p1 TRINITY_DN19035_c0_g1~~TRINITY_DN19035_c0_g1_i1.p1  ORF type:complete len:262 (-),score=39.83 TRINITY_DN19035_c0_g1_i1:517-1302(-)